MLFVYGNIVRSTIIIIIIIKRITVMLSLMSILPQHGKDIKLDNCTKYDLELF